MDRVERLGRYEVGRVLGEGGAGRVYEAVFVGPGAFRRPVALKVLHDGSGLIEREARIGGLLRHRHLVDVYEVGHDAGRWFCAMELCDDSLAAHLPLPPRAVVEVGLQVCAALQYAHEELGLVHLDIKPDNLLLAGGVVKLGDPGIALAAGFDGRAGIRGTPGYMAPEQARAAPVDARADVYALGVTLAELATGQRPGAATTVDWLDDPGDAAPESSQVPEWLAPAVDRSLERDPEDRWPDMAALAEALRALPCTGPGLRSAVSGPLETVAPRAPATTNLGATDPDAVEIVGRDAELEAIEAALAEPCVLTLKGPPGIGKSKLAAVAVGRWAREGRQVWLCPVSEAKTPDRFVEAIAGAMGIALTPGAGTPAHVAQLAHSIASRDPIVIVVDDVEPFDGLPSVLDRLHAGAPRARWVATARSALGVGGENVVEIGPLPPADAAALLVARASLRGAVIADDPDVAELVDRLDGVPLALELAAGRLGVLSVREILDRLGLSLLRRGTEDRHGTLAAALQVSWDLLEPADQAALAQLSVFAGHFSLEAAEAVVASGAALDALSTLVDRSLLSPAPRGRFRLLASTRMFAAAKLEDDDGPLLRHARFYAQFGQSDAIESLDSADRAEPWRALAAELDNLLAACRSSIATGDVGSAVDTLRAVWAVAAMRGAAEVDALSAAVSALAADDPERLARAQFIRAGVLRQSGRPALALEAIEVGRRAAERAGSPTATAYSLLLCSAVHTEMAQFERAAEVARQALALARDVDDAALVPQCLNILGVAHSRQQPEVARAMFEQALDAYGETGFWRYQAHVLANLAHLDVRLGDVQLGRSRLERSLAIARAVGDQQAEANLLVSLGNLDTRQDRQAVASAELQEALALFRALGDRRQQGVVLGSLANLAADRGDLDQARGRYEAAVTLLRETGDRLAEGVVLSNLGALHLDAGRPELAEHCLTDAAAVHQELGAAGNEGFARGSLAIVHESQGRLHEARDGLDRALELLSLGKDLRFLPLFAAYRARVQARLGEVAPAVDAVARARQAAEESGEAAMLAQVLCLEADVLWRAGHADAARAALDRAVAVGPADHADVEREVARTRALLSGRSTPPVGPDA